MIPRETLQELTHLRDRVAYLEAELESVKTQRVDGALNLHRNLGVSIGMARGLAALSAGGVLSRDQMLCACDNPDGSPRLADSIVKRIRKRLAWIEIKSHYGYGYSLEPESLKTIRQAMKEGN